MSRKKRTTATINETLANAAICFTRFVFIVALTFEENCGCKKVSSIAVLEERELSLGAHVGTQFGE